MFLFALGGTQFNNAFALSIALGSFAPTISAFIVTYIEEKSNGVADLLKRGVQCRKKSYLVLSIILIPGLCFLSLYLAIITEGRIPLEIGSLVAWEDNIPMVISTFFLGGPLQEEFGWRGFVLDRLQRKYSSFKSSIIVGIIWGFWHLPFFFLRGAYQYDEPFYSFLTTVMLTSVLFSWVYNNTNGSVLAVMILHTSFNVSYWIIPINYTVMGPIYYRIMLGIIFVALLFLYGPKHLIRVKKKKQKKTYQIQKYHPKLISSK
jgi:membrane protease YdiL (CAAX protease family)